MRFFALTSIALASVAIAAPVPTNSTVAGTPSATQSSVAAVAQPSHESSEWSTAKKAAAGTAAGLSALGLGVVAAKLGHYAFHKYREHQALQPFDIPEDLQAKLDDERATATSEVDLDIPQERQNPIRGGSNGAGMNCLLAGKGLNKRGECEDIEGKVEPQQDKYMGNTNSQGPETVLEEEKASETLLEEITVNPAALELTAEDLAKLNLNSFEAEELGKFVGELAPEDLAKVAAEVAEGGLAGLAGKGFLEILEWFAMRGIKWVH